MKLKSQPEDFVVEEMTNFEIASGPFAFYRLEKTGLGTPEAAQAIVAAWQLKRDAVKHGGLKDRHAQTTQHVSIFRGPQEDLEDRSFRLTYLGQATREFTAKDIAANRFEIRLRNLHADKLDTIRARLAILQGGGLVNYFDDQRFGSLGVSGQFIGQPWCLGDYERALYLSIAEPNVHDRPREKTQKEILRNNWNDWPACKADLDRSHRRSIVTYLCDHPTDFRRALALLRPDLRSIYLAAFQSYLWNRWLSDILASILPPNQQQTINSLCGPLVVPAMSENCDIPNANELCGSDNIADPEELIKTKVGFSLPLPAARQHDYPETWLPTLNAILTSLSMDVHQLRVKFPRDAFFSRGDRQIWLHVQDFVHAFVDDSNNPNRSALELQFTLPRGAYATMVVKFLMADVTDT